MKASTTLIAVLAVAVSVMSPAVEQPPEANSPAVVVNPATESQLSSRGAGTPTAAPPSAATAATSAQVILESNRTYLLTKPKSGSVTRLVVALHWSNGTAAKMREKSGFDAMALASGDTVVVYPEGVNRSWNAGGCCRQNAEDDVGFLDDLISSILESHPTIDSVVMFGKSNGGMMAYRYWLEGEHRIKAFAVQAGAISEGGDLAPHTAVPYAAHLMHWHGALDSVVPIVGRDSDDLSRASRSPYCPLFATVSLAVAAADASLNRWLVRDDLSSVTVWKGTHTIRLRVLPESGHGGGSAAPWPGDRYDFPWRWLLAHSS